MPAAGCQGFDVLHLPAGKGAAAASLGAWPATASAQVATVIGPGNQSRPAAVRADGAPRPRAWYADAHWDCEQVIWRRHEARATASAGLFADHAQDDPGHPGAVRPRAGTPTVVTVSRVNHAGDCRLALLQPHRLDSLTAQNQTGGGHLDVVPVQPLPAAPAAC